jgi:hypothetical protein
LVTVSSRLTVNDLEAELWSNVESPANVAVSVTVLAGSFELMRQVAVPVASVTAEQVGGGPLAPAGVSVKVTVLPGMPTPLLSVSRAWTCAASLKSAVVALAGVNVSRVGDSVVVACFTVRLKAEEVFPRKLVSPP